MSIQDLSLQSNLLTTAQYEELRRELVDALNRANICVVYAPSGTVKLPPDTVFVVVNDGLLKPQKFNALKDRVWEIRV